MRPIDADALLELWDSMTPRARTEFDQNIMLFPQVEAEPVRRGRWIGIDDFPHDVWECDMCGYVYEDIPPLHHYCPNCGAKMEEGNDRSSDE